MEYAPRSLGCPFSSLSLGDGPSLGLAQGMIGALPGGLAPHDRIGKVLATSRIRPGEHLAGTPQHHVKVYNNHVPQPTLGLACPVEFLAQWGLKQPEHSFLSLKSSGLDIGLIPATYPPARPL